MAILVVGGAVWLLVSAVGTSVLVHTWMWFPVCGVRTTGHVLTCETREALGLDFTLGPWDTIVFPRGSSGVGMVDVSTGLVAARTVGGVDLLIIPATLFCHDDVHEEVGGFFLAHWMGAGHTFQAMVRILRRAREVESGVWIERSFSYHVGRLLLPVIQNHTGSSTFSSRGLTLFQREEGVIVDTSLHGDTKEVRGTVLISAVVRALTCC